MQKKNKPKQQTIGFTNCDPLIAKTLENRLKWRYSLDASGDIVMQTINTNPAVTLSVKIQMVSNPYTHKEVVYILNWKGRNYYLKKENGHALCDAIKKWTTPFQKEQKRNIATLGSLKEQLIAPSEDIELVSASVKVTSAIIACENKNHAIYDTTGIIDVMNPYSKVLKVGIPIYYCKTCDKYYMYKSDFYWAKQYGILMCHIEKEVRTYNIGNYDLREKSVLKEFGYDVSKEHDYSSQYRQSLLQYLMDYNVVSKQKVLNLLEFFISSHEGNMNFSDACYKWKQDRDYVVNYHKEDAKQYSVKIDEIIYRVPLR